MMTRKARHLLAVALIVVGLLGVVQCGCPPPQQAGSQGAAIVPAVLSRLAAPDGSPDPALEVDVEGNVIVPVGTVSTTAFHLNNGDAGLGRVLVSDADGDASWTDVYTTGYIAGSWHITGNVGTSADNHFIGTTDNVAFSVRVNNKRALRIEPNATSPNLIGGYFSNTVSTGKVGSVIGGGGAATYGADSSAWNVVQDSYCVIGGGIKNTNSAQYSFVGGGALNTIGNGSYYSVIGGGTSNGIAGSSEKSTICGGYSNAINMNCSTIGGGCSNDTASQFATVAGGWYNTANGHAATVAGGQGNTATGYWSTIGGGLTNTIVITWANYSVIPGGAGNIITGSYAFAGGHRAQAAHDGVFIWADSTDADYISPAADSFNVRATGGVTLTTSGQGLSVDGPIIVDGMAFTYTAPLTISGVLTNVRLLYYQAP